MTKKDLLTKANAEVVSAGRATRFNNAMKKFNLVAEFSKHGIDVTKCEGFDAEHN